MEAGERTCRSRHVRNSGSRHLVATVPHLPFGCMVCWKKWAARHECEGLKEGVWLEPIQAMLRRKSNETWTNEHRHVTSKLVVEGGSWSDEKRCRGCNKEEGTQVVSLPIMEGGHKPDPRKSGEVEAKGPQFRKETVEKVTLFPRERVQQLTAEQIEDVPQYREETFDEVALVSRERVQEWTAGPRPSNFAKHFVSLSESEFSDLVEKVRRDGAPPPSLAWETIFAEVFSSGVLSFVR